MNIFSRFGRIFDGGEVLYVDVSNIEADYEPMLAFEGQNTGFIHVSKCDPG